jgi:hypothetical protein
MGLTNWTNYVAITGVSEVLRGSVHRKVKPADSVLTYAAEVQGTI